MFWRPPGGGVLSPLRPFLFVAGCSLRVFLKSEWCTAQGAPWTPAPYPLPWQLILTGLRAGMIVRELRVSRSRKRSCRAGNISPPVAQQGASSAAGIPNSSAPMKCADWSTRLRSACGIQSGAGCSAACTSRARSRRRSSPRASAGPHWSPTTPWRASRRRRRGPARHAGGTPSDPDSDAGRHEAKRHEHAAAAYLEGRHVLRLAGAAAERVVDSVCVQDQAPAGFHELDALRAGLQALSTWWSARRKAGPR